MRFGADHRPEMLDHIVNGVELGESGLCDIFQRFAGGVGKQMQMEALGHPPTLLAGWG